MAYGMTLEDADGRMESLINEINESAGGTLSMEDFSELGPVIESVTLNEDNVVEEKVGGRLLLRQLRSWLKHWLKRITRSNKRSF